METAVFHSVNSSLLFYRDGCGILVDGIHRGREQSFSEMAPGQVRDLKRREGIFRITGSFIFTHTHPDHYDKELLEAALAAGAAEVYGPEVAGQNVTSELIGDEIYRVKLKGGTLYAKRTLHDGKTYEESNHQSFLLRMGDETFFIAGDAHLTGKDCPAFMAMAGGHVTAGFFNLYQLWSQDGVEFLREMAPDRAFINHLPFKEDDDYNYYRLTRQVLRRLPDDVVRPEMLEPMIWIGGAADGLS